MFYSKQKITKPKKNFKMRLIDYFNKSTLLLLFLIILSNHTIDSARVYKGKKRVTNSPIYFISAPFLPNKKIDAFPPLIKQSNHLPIPSNIIKNVYKNLNDTNLSSPVESFDTKLLNKLKTSILNETNNSIFNKIKNDPKFLNNFNSSMPKDQVYKLKIKRKNLKDYVHSNINQQSIRTIKVNFSLFDLQKTLNNFEHNLNNSKPPIVETKNIIDTIKPEASSINEIQSNELASLKNIGDDSLNLLGEILLKSLRSKQHNLPLVFKSNGQPNEVIFNHNINPNTPKKKIKMKMNQNSKIVNLKLKYLSNAHPLRALINPFGYTKKPYKISKKDFYKINKLME